MEALGYKIAVMIFALQALVGIVRFWKKRQGINRVIWVSRVTINRSRHVYLAVGRVELWCAGGWASSERGEAELSHRARARALICMRSQFKDNRFSIAIFEAESTVKKLLTVPVPPCDSRTDVVTVDQRQISSHEWGYGCRWTDRRTDRQKETLENMGSEGINTQHDGVGSYTMDISMI
jgi:hypothetical protein